MNLKKNKNYYFSDFLSNFEKESDSVYRLKSENFNFEETINQLEKNSKVRDLKNVRICLHESDNSNVQYMIIFHSSDYKVPIHRHRSKSEFLKLHKGSCTYKDYKLSKGEFIINKKIKLNVDSVIVVPKNKWHNFEIHEDIVFTEVSEGPFNSLSTEFASTI